jgi:2-oxoglutarate/2-oxoacid ferredoxin oxidoreductase subunit alpha
MKQSFDIADTYRNPVMILADGLIGQMMESVDMDKPVKKRHIEPKTMHQLDQIIMKVET